MKIFLKGLILTCILVLFFGQQVAVAIPAEKIPWIIFFYGTLGYAIACVVIGLLVSFSHKTK